MNKTKFSSDARVGIKKGINDSANAIKTTYGYRGELVLIERRFQMPDGKIETKWFFTKDGVTVGKSVKPFNTENRLGADIIRTASEKSVNESGDGTTLTAILAQHLVNSGEKLISSGSRALDIKKGMDLAYDSVCNILKENSLTATNEDGTINLSSLTKIANTSANDDKEITDVIVKTMSIVGTGASIDITLSGNDTTSVETAEGVIVETGYISEYFITNTQRNICELENPYILMYDRKISNIKDFLGLVQEVAIQHRSILIICSDMDGEALQFCVANKMNGAFHGCVVRCPGYSTLKRTLMEDINKAVGGKFISDEKGKKLDGVQISSLGQALKVIVSNDEMTIIGGKGEPVALASYIDDIKLASLNPELSEGDRANLTKRHAYLTGAVAKITVGGNTDADMNEKKDRIEDALSAVKAAEAEGVIAGGASAFLKISPQIKDINNENKDIQEGINMVANAIEEPFKQLMINAGLKYEKPFFGGTSLFVQVQESGFETGFDLKTEKIVNMYDAGVEDAVKVLRCALKNAISVAGLYISTGATILPCEKSEA